MFDHLADGIVSTLYARAVFMSGPAHDTARDWNAYRDAYEDLSDHSKRAFALMALTIDTIEGFALKATA